MGFLDIVLLGVLLLYALLVASSLASFFCFLRTPLGDYSAATGDRGGLV